MPTIHTYTVYFSAMPDALDAAGVVAEAADHLYTQDGEQLRHLYTNDGAHVYELATAMNGNEAESWADELAQNVRLGLVAIELAHA